MVHSCVSGTDRAWAEICYTAAAIRRRQHRGGDTAATATTRWRWRHDGGDMAAATRWRRHGGGDTAAATRLWRHGGGDTVAAATRRWRHGGDTVATRRRHTATRRRHDGSGDTAAARRRRHDVIYFLFGYLTFKKASYAKINNSIIYVTYLLLLKIFTPSLTTVSRSTCLAF